MMDNYSFEIFCYIIDTNFKIIKRYCICVFIMIMTCSRSFLHAIMIINCIMKWKLNLSLLLFEIYYQHVLF